MSLMWLCSLHLYIAAMQMSDGQLHKAAGLQQHLGQLHSLQNKILGQPEMHKISQVSCSILFVLMSNINVVFHNFCC